MRRRLLFMSSGPTPPTPTVDGTEFGYDYVDFGTFGKWATKNIGATKVTDTGHYFQWGDTIGHTKNENFSFNMSSYKYARSVDNVNHYENFLLYNRYDKLDKLQLTEDAATVVMGRDSYYGWRTPTKAEWENLVNNCNIEEDDNYEGSGVAGLVFTLKTNQNKKLFFPNCGYYKDAISGGVNEPNQVQLWTSSMDMDNFEPYKVIKYQYSNLTFEYGNRIYGCPIRAIWGAIDVNVYYSVADGYEYVHAPSLGKMALWNIGATGPQDIGLYFAWGETTGYANRTAHNFSWSNYQHCGYPKSVNTINKYTTSDGRTVLEDSDNPAKVNINSNWDMIYNQTNFKGNLEGNYDLTIETFRDVLYPNDPNFKQVEGIRATNKTNKKISIFFPFTGYIDGNTLKEGTTQFNTWCSQVFPEQSGDRSKAYYLTVLKTTYNTPSTGGGNAITRCYGLPVRPIYQG